MKSVRVVLISTYELGRQPFGLASPAAWLRSEGHDVTCADLSCSPLPRQAVEEADLIAFFLPMHTATRLLMRLLDRVRALNPRAHLCGYGLYAPLNEPMLRRGGIATILGGEFEHGIVNLARRLANGESGPQREPLVSLERQKFLVPDRTGMPPLGAYARLVLNGSSRVVGYTEASRGCKHMCRHCPVVPVYQGAFRVVSKEVVLEDIRRQVAAGAQHITFGDPDFWNGPGHAVSLVESLHAEWPSLTYDVTIKVEHLLRHRELIPRLKETGCLLVTTAVESLDDAVLEKLEKGHTRADFLEALALTRGHGLALAPTFIPFTPWTTGEGYRDFLRLLVDLNLVAEVPPIQLAIRLLIPAGSRLLDLPEIAGRIGPFDAHALVYPWRHPDSGLDRLCRDLQETIKQQERRHAGRAEIFRRIWDAVEAGPWLERPPLPARATIPYLTEPWYC
jgi:radical SAM superfamily enzyme YgiQ (UPF0313 family)